MSKNKVTETVTTFLDRACNDIGRLASEDFSQEMFSNCREEMESPIEHLFWIACHVVCAAERTPVNAQDSHYDELTKRRIWYPSRGIHIYPQHQVEKYRVDFLLKQNSIAPDHIYTPVIVELDGHDFHDKNKQQRAYEKGRDRFLTKKGFRVLHFTGSEVFADPYKAATEVLAMLALFVGSGRSDDDGNPTYKPHDPFDRGW